jgi:DNA-binding MarR family transcriptional regulator
LPLPGIDLHPEESGDSTYLGYHDGQPGWCTGTTFVVTAVIYESTTIPTPATQNQPTLNPVAEDTLWNSMPSLNTLLLALLLVGMAGAGIGTARNEAIRFPLHQAMGAFTQTLRGNNRRSVEAAFQRGRIVGFLVPNQGCHLSALVRSLNMGNNQAAHHLKILEDEGLIWRRKDGRHLRFYTVDILRTAKGAQLPTPPLNLDTAGLPYRLLRLISAIKNEGGRARTPNQRQLATALGTSQQLISHHLMTLETNGLILRSRDGIRTRLSLTPAGDAAAAQVNDSS